MPTLNPLLLRILCLALSGTVPVACGWVDSGGSNSSPSVSATAAEQVADEQTEVTITATATDDFDLIVSAECVQVSGVPVELTPAELVDLPNGGTEIRATFMAPTLTQPEVLVFRCIVTDNAGQTDRTTITVTVNPVNELPRVDAGDDRAVDFSSGVTLSGTATDSDGSIVAFAWTQTSGEAVTLSEGQRQDLDTGEAVLSTTFTAPLVTSLATLTFSLSVTDNENGASTDSVTITVNPNLGPIVNDDGPYTVPEGGILVVNAEQGVLANDEDREGDEITATPVGSPVNGTLLLNADGSFTYEHDGSETISDRFTYTASDGLTTSTAAAASIIVTPVNDPPVITGQANPLTTEEDTPLTIRLGDVTVSDIDSTFPDDFTLSVLNGSNYSRSGNTVTPAEDFTGQLSVPVRVNDGESNSNVFNLTVTVTPVNDAPVITGQRTLSTPEETPLTIQLTDLVVDDPDDAFPDEFTLTVFDGANYTRSGNTITPVDDFNGTLNVPVRVNDGSLNSNTVNLNVTVTAVNDPPVAVNDRYVITGTFLAPTPEQGVLANDRDPENDSLTMIVVQQPSQAIGFFPGLDGTFIYVPSATFFGTDTFTYQASDGQAQSNIATVTITLGVAGASLATVGSVASGECWTTRQDQVLRAALGSSTAAAEGTTYSLVGGPSKGTVSVEPSGAFTYTPSTSRGRDVFAYRMEGPAGGPEIRLATVIVQQRIMPLGDSTTTGIINGPEGLPSVGQRVGYRKPLYDALAALGYRVDFVGGERFGSEISDFDADNEGHEGWSLNELAFGSPSRDPSYPDSGIYAWLGRHGPDVVLMHVGTDVLPSDASGVEAMLDEIDRWEADTGQPVTAVVALAIDRDPRIEKQAVTQFNTALEAMVLARIERGDRLVLVDQHSALEYPADLSDGIHPTAGGYEKMARVWLFPLTETGTVTGTHTGPGLLDRCP